MKPIDPRLWLKIRDWSEERLYEWNERAAIIEYDGNTPRVIAEQEAYEQLKSATNGEKG